MTVAWIVILVCQLAKAAAECYLPKNVHGVQILKDVGSGKFKVLSKKGVACRLSKMLNDRDGHQGPDHHQIIHGIDEGEWVKVARVYLPKNVNGVQVLEDVGKGFFKVLPEKGVAYRLSKDLKNRVAGRGADHQQTIYGIDDGDWIKTLNIDAADTAIYLPKKLDGVEMLEHLHHGRYKVVAADGLAFRFSKNLEDIDGDKGLDKDSWIDGEARGDWVKVKRVNVGTSILSVDEYIRKGAKMKKTIDEKSTEKRTEL
eukprot:gnl/MRDRNA2_/MRDRNA2_44857_c0_seq1.p1 gnl/MRDRNA2_/MRDRNA2_44857_c0~~gnl/MRDRNA2_/MRDRNA2_44857_c0_seq1.p1  ORF type:complete len:286 (-),score=45.62 gnl/MRDRNA2_/MRDRNA2_44857_c0_seq1:165-935(-)